MPHIVNLLVSKIICIISYVDNFSQGKFLKILVTKPIIWMGILIQKVWGLIGTSYQGAPFCWLISNTVNTFLSKICIG